MQSATSLQPDLGTQDAVRRALQGALSGHWELDVATGVVWCSAPLLNQLGYSQNDPLIDRCDLVSLIHAEDIERFQLEVKACQAGSRRFETDFRLRAAAGEMRWYRASASASLDEFGQVTHLSGDLRDISVERDAIQHLREAERQLHQQERMDALDCLAGGIAHEFNNVLQAVRGYVSFAMDELADNTQAFDDLQQALEATDRASRLTRSLLDFARAENQESERFDIRDVIAGLDNMLRPVIGEDINFRTTTTSLPMVTHCDLQALRQSLLNLCINSRDAMPDGGELVVSAHGFVIDETTSAAFPDLDEGCYCRIQVTDSGSGMPIEIQKKIFDPFFSTKEVGRGTGLGLASVYGFAQRSGGRVAVYSEPGRGTTFSVYLPIEEERSMKNDLSSPELLAESPSLVLLVEDDAQVREVGRRSLEAAGYEVLVAGDGESGLELYIEHADRVELVVLDVVLPGLGGRRVFEEIRRLQSDVPVIFTTGFDPESTLGANGGQLADKTIAKPYDRSQLLVEVKKLLRQQSLAPESIC